MRFAICQELFVDWDWKRQCQFVAECGYTGIEVAPFTIASSLQDVPVETFQSMRKEAESAGLEIIGLHWLLAKTEGLHLTSTDADVRKATAEYLATLGDACAELGGQVMVFGSPPQRNLPEGVSTEQGLEYAAEIFKSCMPRIADRGVQICMEPLTTKETDFINTCADAKTLIEMVDHPSFVLHQDVKAMLGAESEPLPVVIEKYKDITKHFHANDSNLLGPGMGETDFVPIFEALLKTDYQGWVSVEVFDYAPGAETIARTSLAAMQDALEAARKRIASNEKSA
ncbi:sugar phosphate isomerase/epimerase family protein [Thalassoroseus pseudoceratinae]|uniref:sugar phosphate isomerase/epimerase family protein n=1 Tax=Thalassoroseus pseudoceratinae TaxID=2713176 RepID=UPI001423BD83|nr:sugar phosphate isomerase/epimerase family protein [Thalassoroseus pseudoceratinae]